MTVSNQPTPLERHSLAGVTLWVKRDDRSHPIYGGNKPRKLLRILEEAAQKRARRLVTFGAAGSHHVLATSLFGRASGFEVAAVLVPQRRTEHVVEVLRASVGQGVDLRACARPSALPAVLARLLRPGDRVIPPGGSTRTGSLGFVDAAMELRAQLDALEDPGPDLVVVATGSGGTAAGLAVGAERARLPSRIACVSVASTPVSTASMTAALTARLAHAAGVSVTGALRRLCFIHHHAGEGYGERTRAGEEAARHAMSAGLLVDPTYTEKALAAAIELAAGGSRRWPRPQRVLFWHTLSSTSMQPLLARAPSEDALPDGLRSLLL